MFIEQSNILSADKIKDTQYRIRLFIPVRPESSVEYLEFFKKVALQFCSDYNCKFNDGLDVALSPANESAILVFNVKEYKHPDKHKLHLKKYYRIR